MQCRKIVKGAENGRKIGWEWCVTDRLGSTLNSINTIMMEWHCFLAVWNDWHSKCLLPRGTQATNITTGPAHSVVNCDALWGRAKLRRVCRGAASHTNSCIRRTRLIVIYEHFPACECLPWINRKFWDWIFPLSIFYVHFLPFKYLCITISQAWHVGTNASEEHVTGLTWFLKQFLFFISYWLPGIHPSHSSHSHIALEGNYTGTKSKENSRESNFRNQDIWWMKGKRINDDFIEYSKSKPFFEWLK